MSLFKKMLATVGIGAAEVDMQIDDARVAAGGSLSGTVRIRGGRVDQEVDDVYAYVMTSYLKESNDRKMNVDAVIAKVPLAGKMLVKAGQAYEFPFAFSLPNHTPATMGRTRVWIQTGLDIKEAVDPKDRDGIEVYPHPHARVVLDAVQALGFRLRSVSNEYSPRYGKSAPFVQEFEFVPSNQFRGQLDELEVILYPEDHGVELLLQIDRKARGLMGLLAEVTDTDESFVRCGFSAAELARGERAIAEQLAALIRRYV
jgi:sporulation-control protein